MMCKILLFLQEVSCLTKLHIMHLHMYVPTREYKWMGWKIALVTFT